MLFKFLAKRVGILTIVGVIFSFFLGGFSKVIPLGVLLGSATAMYKFYLNNRLMAGVCKNGITKKKTLFFQFVMQLMSFSVLVVAILVEVELFVGTAIGLLLLPAVIGVNAITEAAGITHNQWGE